jgi:Flp pilus assembly protein CpaB
MVSVQETIKAARQRRPFTILGIMIALLTLGSFVFVATRVGEPGAVTVLGSTVSVVVARNAIHARDPLSAGDLVVRQLPQLPVGGFADLRSVGLDVQSPKYAIIDIPAGQPLVANALAKSQGEVGGVPPPFLNIAPGYIAMTIPTSEQQGVAGYIQPGDYIGIIAVLDVGSTTVAKTVFTQVHVLQLGAASFDSAGKPIPRTGPSSSLTIAVTECDAEYLIWFLARASLRYVLESHADYATAAKPSNCAIDQAKGVTSADILARFGVK